MLQTVPKCSEDEDFLFQVYTSTRLEEIRAWGLDELSQQAFLQMQWKAQQRSYAVQYPNADERIIFYHKIRVGRIIVFRDAPSLTLVDISLLPDFCNRGIGTSLLQKLQAEAASTNKPLRLSVLQTNKAKRLYARLGFFIIESNGLYDRMEWCAAKTSRAFQ